MRFCTKSVSTAMLVLASLLTPLLAAEHGALIPVGAAKVDVTPTHPTLLAGYGGRTSEHEGVDARIWARALAIGDTAPVVLVAVDNCGVPAAVVETVAGRVGTKRGIKRERFVVCSTHTHSAPTLTGYAPVVWGGRASAKQLGRVDQYTRWLTERLVKVSLAALDARQPARLVWGQGRVAFGGNRRVLENGVWRGFGFQRDGPVDHNFPLLIATSSDGKPIAVWTNYACHCTTLGSRNRICGDWAGFANQFIEEAHPGAVSLTTIGCGADIGPQPSGGLELAKRHGKSIADEVKRLLGGRLTPLLAAPSAQMRRIQLPLAKPPAPDHWQRQVEKGGFYGYHATLMLARLKQDGRLPTHVAFPITAWTFGDDLAIVFLAGEVVVDYAVRLKTELDWTRLWINGWSNDVPCYIPSRRILSEGGYEADFSMVYYGHPTRFDPAIEDTIIDTVKDMLGPTFKRRKDQRPAPNLRCLSGP